MNSNNNQDERQSFVREANAKLIRFASVLIAVAIIMACFSYTKLQGETVGMAVYVLAGLVASFGLFIIFIVIAGMRMEKKKVNFFLYDKKKKCDISPDELTVSIIRQRLISYMALFKHKGKLYVGDLFDERHIAVPEAIKPLFCYELLCEIADDGGANASVFLSFGTECANIFSKYLCQNDDSELAREINSYFAKFDVNKESAAAFREYIVSKKAHIEEKMLNYTLTNLEKFN